MSKKTGRIRCGSCQRVLEDPDAYRKPTRGELSDYDRLPDSMAKGRQLYELRKPSPMSSTGDMWQDPTGEWWRGWHCRCGRAYAIADDELALLRVEAKSDRGEDLFLTNAHLLRPTRR
ncbi:hypothetical protein SCMU_27660 [Sinomonas cyclohexanicum]|uniref:Uncharacterized protein n=1 Tax=Sinomonas cyclohexanicum TaxID=322009 RepID=A0ABN6FJS7_SINCY|nr:hypothetical protein SCMU_27660 [Corynebacterium cyclohexanicum]